MREVEKRISAVVSRLSEDENRPIWHVSHFLFLKIKSLLRDDNYLFVMRLDSNRNAFTISSQNHEMSIFYKLVIISGIKFTFFRPIFVPLTDGTRRNGYSGRFVNLFHRYFILVLSLFRSMGRACAIVLFGRMVFLLFFFNFRGLFFDYFA